MAKKEWEPIENFFNNNLNKIEKFMFMGVVFIDGKEIYKYKHNYTRRYLNLDKDGNTYQYKEGFYLGISRDSALSLAYS